MGALTGGIMSYFIDIKKKKYSYNLGASGSCFSLITFFVLNFPFQKIYLYGFIGIPAWALGSFLFL